MKLQGDGVFIDDNSASLKDQEIEFTYDPMNDNCGYGAVLRYVSDNEYFYVGSNLHRIISIIPDGISGMHRDSHFLEVNIMTVVLFLQIEWFI